MPSALQLGAALVHAGGAALADAEAEQIAAHLVHHVRQKKFSSLFSQSVTQLRDSNPSPLSDFDEH